MAYRSNSSKFIQGCIITDKMLYNIHSILSVLVDNQRSWKNTIWIDGLFYLERYSLLQHIKRCIDIKTRDEALHNLIEACKDFETSLESELYHLIHELKNAKYSYCSFNYLPSRTPREGGNNFSRNILLALLDQICDFNSINPYFALNIEMPLQKLGLLEQFREDVVQTLGLSEYNHYQVADVLDFETDIILSIVKNIAPSITIDWEELIYRRNEIDYGEHIHAILNEYRQNNNHQIVFLINDFRPYGFKECDDMFTLTQKNDCQNDWFVITTMKSKIDANDEVSALISKIMDHGRTLVVRGNSPLIF